MSKEKVFDATVRQPDYMKFERRGTTFAWPSPPRLIVVAVSI